jgi:hypothetical protein
MEIRPGKGVEQLLFGLTEPELVRALGPPDKRYLTDSGARRLQYFGPRLEFSIEPDNGGRFSWVEVQCPEATLFGCRVVGEPIGPVLSQVSESLGEEPDHDDYGSLETFFYPRNWVELQVEFGRVVSVNCGVVYDRADEPLWPTAEPGATADGSREPGSEHGDSICC